MKNASPMRWLALSWIAPLTLVACGQPPVPNLPPDAPSALVYGNVNNLLFDALKNKVRMTTSTGRQKPSDYQLVIFDGDIFTGKQLAQDPLVAGAIRSGTWVLGVDTAEDDKRDGIGQVLGASTRKPSTAYLVRRTRNSTGHIQDWIVDLNDIGAKAEQKAAYILQEINRPKPQQSNVKAQDDPNAPPPSMLHRQISIKRGRFDPLLPQPTYNQDSWKGLSGKTQQTSWTVETIIDIYLDNDPAYQDGPRQWAVVHVVGNANPGTLIINNTDNWWPDNTAEVAWYQTQFLSEVKTPQSFNVYQTSPANINNVETVTTTMGFTIGATGGFQGGKPSGSITASFNYSTTTTKTIRDWQVLNASTSTYARFQFASQNPTNGLITDADDPTAKDWSVAYAKPAKPNGLSLNTIEYDAKAVFNTNHGTLNDGVVTFSGRDEAWYTDVGRQIPAGSALPSTDISRFPGHLFLPDRGAWSVDVNMGAVIPVPMSAMTFNGGGSIQPGQTCVPMDLTLGRKAPADIEIPLYLYSDDTAADFDFASKAQCGTDGDTSDSDRVLVKQGETTGRAYLNVATSTPVGAVGKVLAFYTAPLNASFSVSGARTGSLTLNRPSVLAGEQVTATLRLVEAVAADTDIPISAQSPNQNVATPQRVTVLKGQSTASFTVQTNANGLDSGKSVVVYVSAGTASPAPLKITAAAVANITLQSNPTTGGPNPVLAGLQAQVIVALNTPVTDATVIWLSSSSPNVTVPQLVTVRAGERFTEFTATTRDDGIKPGTHLGATITASLYPGQLTLVVPALTFDRAAVPLGQGATGTVSLDMPLGNAAAIPLTSSSPAITVPGIVTLPAGQTSATFPVGTNANNTDSMVGHIAFSTLTALNTKASFRTTRFIAPKRIDGDGVACSLTAQGGLSCGSRFFPNPIPDGLAGLVEVSVGFNHLCVVRGDRTVACWGDNAGGQLNVPAGLADVAQVSVGYVHSCALKRDGTVTCWGDNSRGQLAVPAGLANVVQVVGSNTTNCALKRNGTVTCWGMFPGSGPPPAGLSNVAHLSYFEDAVVSSGCAVQTNGTVTCWGDNSKGQLAVPAGLANVVQVHVSNAQTCALKDDGTVVCWGSLMANPPAGLSGVTQIAASSGQGWALKPDSTAISW